VPKSMDELRGLPSHRGQQTPRSVYERVRDARRRKNEWQKKRDEKRSFNNDQYIAQEINPT